jgi:hypothetical protein
VATANYNADGVRRLIRGALLTAWTCLASGLLIMIGGALTIPLAGWGAAYVFAIGLWLAVGSLVPALVWLFLAVIHRVRAGLWYFGIYDAAA